MNILMQELRFWELIHHLVSKEGMRVIHISDSSDEVWLEDDRIKPYRILRIASRDFDWSNELRRDIDVTTQRAKQLKKQLGITSAEFINLVLTLYEPVDSYDELVNGFQIASEENSQQRTFLIPLDKLSEYILSLVRELKWKESPTFVHVHETLDIDSIIHSLRYSIKTSSMKRLKKERELFLYGKPFFTYVLLGLVIAIFTIMEIYGSSTSTQTLIEFGAKFNPLIIEGEWWRFFSAMFLHIGILHLLMNSLALFYLGTAVERIYGTSRYILIYFIAGFVGSVASFAFNEHVSAGASGAIFGCFGALIYFGVKHPRLFFRTMGMNVIFILILNLGFGFIVPAVDNGAHIGGLIGGFFASAIVGLPKHRFTYNQIIITVVFIVCMIGLTFFGYSQEETEKTHAIYFQLGYDYLRQENLSEAKPYFEKIINNKSYDDSLFLTETYFYLAYIQANMKENHEAMQNLLKTIERNPMFHEAHYNLALLYIEEENYEEAYTHVIQAIEINPDTENYNLLKDELQSYLTE